MLAEMKGLACQQLAEEIRNEQCVTLHSNGKYIEVWTALLFLSDLLVIVHIL